VQGIERQMCCEEFADGFRSCVLAMRAQLVARAYTQTISTWVLVSEAGIEKILAMRGKASPF
jgi:hypothetical protein